MALCWVGVFFRSRTARLGGPKVWRARRNFADSQEGSDVSLYHDVSTAPLLDLRRRLTLVVDLLSSMIRGGVSLARSVELAVQWDAILRAGSIHPITAEDFLLARGLFVVGEVGCVRIHLFIQKKWLRPELVPPAPFLQCDPALTPGGSGVLVDPLRIDEEFRKAWLPYFCLSTKGDRP